MLKNFETFQQAGRDNLDLVFKSAEAVNKGFQEIAKEAADYSKKSFDAQAAAFDKVVASKSVEKAVEAQTDYARSSYEAFVAQASKMGELYAGVAKEAYKPFESTMPKAAAK